MTDYNDYWDIHSKDFCINLPKTSISSRMDLFRAVLPGKKVLHVGCTDWPFTNEKIRNGELLHQMFAEITTDLYGLDIEAPAIEIMQQKGIPNLVALDICSICTNDFLMGKNFDYIVISEVIEHLANPGQALSSIHEFVSRTNPVCKIIFTVPNYQNFLIQIILGLQGKECVHPDHKYYFSYRTFRTLLEHCGFHVTDFQFIIYTERSHRLGGIPLKTASRFFPALAPHLYFVCSIRTD